MQINIIYHYFALYRKPIIKALICSEEDEYFFVADSKNRLMPGVVVADIPEDRFIEARCFPLLKGLMYQAYLIRMSLFSESDAFIFLGDWKWPATWVSALICRMRKKRVLFWTHGWRVPDTGLKKRLRKVFYSIPHGLLLYGNRAKRIGIEMGFAPDSLYVVYNSLDYERHKFLRNSISQETLIGLKRELYADIDHPILLCSARLNKSKKLDLLVEAAALLKDKGCPVNVLLIGDGDAKNDLERLAEDLEVDIHFVGACFDDEQIAAYTLISDITVCPGATGLTVIQSMAFGVPVITNDDFSIQGPEVEAVIEGETGAFFEVGSCESLMKSIMKLVNRSVAEKQEMKDYCRKIVDVAYNPSFQTKVFADAIRGRPARPENLESLVSSMKEYE